MPTRHWSARHQPYKHPWGCWRAGSPTNPHHGGIKLSAVLAVPGGASKPGGEQEEHFHKLPPAVAHAGPGVTANATT